jgi:hypothetical protein
MAREGYVHPSARPGPYTPTRGQFAGVTFRSFRQYQNTLAQGKGFRSQVARLRAPKPATTAAALRDRNGQVDQDEVIPARANYVRNLVRLLVRADENGEGRILGIFGNRRAQHVAAVLATYPDDERPRIAKLLHAWGTACVETASPYLSEGASRER